MATGRVPTTANSPLTAKGDLFTYSTAPARLPVGNDGETIVADSSTSTGLSYQANWAAGKNKIINGAFSISQRGTSFSSVASGTYTLDRWMSNYDGTAGTYTISQQAFTAGTAPVAGYESQFFARYAVTVAGTGGAVRAFDNRMEDVRTFAGQTVTVSFWAKADASRSVGVQLYQNFGSGGSGEVYTSGTSASVTTSWARYSTTISVPSISGKTIGTSSFLGLRLTIPYGATATIDVWGVQAEAGSVATAFQTATGTLQGELAACQRYFQRLVNGSETTNEAITLAQAYGTSGAIAALQWLVPMRTTPTMTVSAISHFAIFNASASDLTATTFALTSSGTTSRHGRLDVGVSSGLVGGNAGYVRSISASSTLDISAEL